MHVFRVHNIPVQERLSQARERYEKKEAHAKAPLSKMKPFPTIVILSYCPHEIPKQRQVPQINF